MPPPPTSTTRTLRSIVMMGGGGAGGGTPTGTTGKQPRRLSNKYSPRSNDIIIGSPGTTSTSTRINTIYQQCKYCFIILLGTTGIGIFLWVIGTILWSIFLSPYTSTSNIVHINDTISNSTITYFQTTLDTIPNRYIAVELWPDHHYHTNYHMDDNNPTSSQNDTIEDKLLDLYTYDCLPIENSDCQERLQKGSSSGISGSTNKDTTTIAIIRSPGILGEIIEEYIIDSITDYYKEENMDEQQNNNNNNNNNKIHIIKTSHIDPDDAGHEVYTRIIRSSILPLLLEATDLALRTTGDDYHPNNITLHDITGIVRQLIRWHKRIVYSAGKDTALYTIQLDHLMAYPKDTEKEFFKFMRLVSNTKNNKKKKKSSSSSYVKIMDKLAEKAIQRVDVCNALLMRIIGDNTGSRIDDNTKITSDHRILLQHHSTSISDTNIHKIVDEIVRDEEIADITTAVTQPLRGHPIHRSRVTELVGYYLDRTNKMSEKICRTYPTALMCLYDTSGTVLF